MLSLFYCFFDPFIRFF